MNDILQRIVDQYLQENTYDDMSEEMEKLIKEYETEKYKPKVDKLRKKMSKDDIKEVIHEWWMDYEIADGTEDNLLAYAEGKE